MYSLDSLGDIWEMELALGIPQGRTFEKNAEKNPPISQGYLKSNFKTGEIEIHYYESPRKSFE
jgi:hypothetical protein